MSAIAQMLIAEKVAAGSVYTTWNPSDKAAASVLSNGNLTAGSSSGFAGVRSVASKSSGKWYWEYLAGTAVSGNTGVGVGLSTDGLTAMMGNGSGAAGYDVNGGLYYNFTSLGPIATYTTGDVIGIALDLTGLTLRFHKNSTLVGLFAITSGTYFAMVQPATAGDLITARFDPAQMTYSPPSGYTAGLS